jgi:hypothetical protein
MPSNPLTLLNLCRAIEQTSADSLKEIDRETLLATQKALKALKRDVDRTLLRLSFLDEQSLN